MILVSFKNIHIFSGPRKVVGMIVMKRMKGASQRANANQNLGQVKAAREEKSRNLRTKMDSQPNRGGRLSPKLSSHPVRALIQIHARRGRQ